MEIEVIYLRGGVKKRINLMDTTVSYYYDQFR